MTLAIYLRDLTRGQAKFLVEVRREARQSEEDPSFCKDERPSAELFKEFIEKAKAQLPLKSKKVDVFISCFADQITIEFPVEFMKLVSQNGWKVTFDLND